MTLTLLEEPAYKELVDAAIQDAIQQRGEAPPESDVEAYLEYKAEILNDASMSLVAEFGSLIKAIVWIMYTQEIEQSYRYLPQKYGSLLEWASVCFDNLVENEVYTWDYLRRFVAFVVDVLVPLAKNPVVEDGKVVASPQIIIANASHSAMSQSTFSYVNAQDEQKKSLAIALASGDNSKVNEVRLEIRKAVDQKVTADTAGTKDEKPKPILKWELDPDGNVQVIGILQKNDFAYLQMSVQAHFEFRMGL